MCRFEKISGSATVKCDTGKLLCKVTALTSIEGSNMIFHFINICKVPREVLKTKGKARGFQPSQGTLQMLMNDKIMFYRCYCINTTKHCENEENIGALYFITSHFLTIMLCTIRAAVNYS